MPGPALRPALGGVPRRERPAAEGHAEAVREVAETLGIPLEQAEGSLATLGAQPGVIWELVMRRIAEAWLGGQRRARGLRRKPENL